MGLITGFIEGIITYENNSTAEMLPFSDKIESATFNYSTENLMSETFSNQGIKGASTSCPFREECSMELSSSNLAWSFLQAASNTLARDATVTKRKAVSRVVQSSEISSGDATLEINDWTPADSTQILVSDEEGKQYDYTYDDAASPPTLTVMDPSGDIIAGQKLVISYTEAVSGSNNEIALGSGNKLGEIGLYGRFFGCPDTLLIMIPRAIIQSNLEFSVGEDSATAALTATALRDKNGNFAVINRM